MADFFNENSIENVNLGVRGNDVHCSKNRKDDKSIKGSVYVLEPIGNRSILTADVEGQKIRIIVSNNYDVEMDAEIYVDLDFTDIIFFDRESENFLIRHNQEKLVKEGTHA